MPKCLNCDLEFIRLSELAKKKEEYLKNIQNNSHDQNNFNSENGKTKTSENDNNVDVEKK